MVTDYYILMMICVVMRQMRWSTLRAGAVIEQLDGHNVERLVGHLALARVGDGLHVARAHLDDVAAIELVQSQRQLVSCTGTSMLQRIYCTLLIKCSQSISHLIVYSLHLIEQIVSSIILQNDAEQSLALMRCDAPVDSGGRERAQMAMARSPCATGSSGMRRTMRSSVPFERPSRRASTTQSFPSETATSCTFRFACMDTLGDIAY